MCGLIGLTGVDDVLPMILEGLGRLEYRGYDSAGIALLTEGSVWRTRAAAGTHSVSDLQSLSQDAPLTCRTGVGHTRWATHGQPTTCNAHPHLDCTGRLALVHNGIVENHADLATQLIAEGHVFVSQTDSEVLSHLVESAMTQGTTLAEGLQRALQQVRGSFAVAVVHADEPDLIVAARRVSPLVFGIGLDAAYLASDIPALLGCTRRLFALEDDQMVELRPGTMRVTTLDGSPAEAAPLTIDWDAAVTCQDGYDDYMTKEIHEQPEAVAATLDGCWRKDGSPA